jgi:hypothetical protein
MPPGNACLVFLIEDIAQQVGEDELLEKVQLFCQLKLVLYPALAAGARHVNSYLVCD